MERSGGEEARRLERGKGKAVVVAPSGGGGHDVVLGARAPDADVEGSGGSEGGGEGGIDDSPAAEERKLALVVFACRHVFHRACLDPEYKKGKMSGGGEAERYTCPMCREQQHAK